MKEPETLSAWDFQNTIQISEGYYYESVPDLTRDNFNKLIEEHNNLVEVVQYLLDKAGGLQDE